MTPFGSTTSRSHNLLRCTADVNDSEVSTTTILSGNGVIHNSSQCLLTTKGLQTIPETSGNTKMNFALQEIITPILHDIATSKELQMLHNTSIWDYTNWWPCNSRQTPSTVNWLVYTGPRHKHYEVPRREILLAFPHTLHPLFVCYNFIPHLHFEILLDQTNSHTFHPSQCFAFNHISTRRRSRLAVYR
jgi:hypothetical protein